MAILAGQKVLDSHLCPPPVNSSQCGYRHTPAHQTYIGAGSELRSSCTASTLHTEPFPQSQSNGFFTFFSYVGIIILGCNSSSSPAAIPHAPSHGAGAFDKIYWGPNYYFSTLFSLPTFVPQGSGKLGRRGQNEQWRHFTPQVPAFCHSSNLEPYRERESHIRPVFSRCEVGEQMI